MTSYAPTTSPAPTTSTRAAAGYGILAALVAAGWSFYGAHTWGEIATVVGVVAVATALVFGLVVPRGLRRENPGNTALALSIPAVLLTLPAFWSGLPLVLGVAGMIVGNAGRSSRSGSGRSIAGLVLGAVAVLGYLTIFVWDGVVLGHAGFLFD